MPHRKDIDGLRAIAVLLVVAFHVHPREVTGGFVGVDVFFVISGFLITGLIQTGLRDGDFRLLDFYARRIRRIFPALAVVLAACLAVGWLVLFPDDYRNLGRHAAASAAFVANFTLWQDIGYFDAPAMLKPLLHLWSLGIEEQFYILWPAVMLLAWRRRGAPLLAACAVLVASFAVNVVVSRADPVAAFFLPTTRFWELMVGCILALVLQAGPPAAAAAHRDHVLARGAASLAGSLMIVLASILIRPGFAFPGWWALLPTVGAALVIAAGPGAWVNRQVLSRPALVWLGLISYPLYLWHWPILAFLRHYSFRPPSDLMRWGAVLLAVVLADLTWRFVENPIRRGRPLASKPLGAALAMALVGCVGVAIVAAGGYARRFPPEIATLLDDADNVAKVFVGSGRCLRDGGASERDLTDECDGPLPAGTRRIAVWGDSHAANLVGGLLRLETARRDVRLIFFATLACPPVPSYAYTRPEFEDCPSANRSALEKLGRIRPDIVILSGNWQQYDGGRDAGRVDAASIRETVARLKALGVARVLGVGQFPVWDYRVDKILARTYRQGSAPLGAAIADAPIRSADFLNPRTFAGDRQAAQWFAAAGAAFLSPLSTLCGGAGCLLTVPGSAAPIARDEDHLTNSGSTWFVTQNEKALLGN